MSDELERRIGKMTNEDLYEMVFIHRNDWTSDSLGLAERQWKKRKLSPDQFKVVAAIGQER